jgi:hypothetical protein
VAAIASGTSTDTSITTATTTTTTTTHTETTVTAIQNGTRVLYINCLTPPCPVGARSVQRGQILFNSCFFSVARTITRASMTTAPHARTPSAPKTMEKNEKGTEAESVTAAGTVLGSGAGTVLGSGAGTVLGSGAGTVLGSGAGMVLGSGAGSWQATTRRGAEKGAAWVKAERGTEAVGWRREMAGEGAQGKDIQAGTLMMEGIVVAIPVICARRMLAAALQGRGVDMADGSAGGGKIKT